MNNTNNQSARDSFRIAKTVFFKAFRKDFNSDEDTQNYVDALKLSQSEIRLEVKLLTTSTSFKFGVTQQQANSSGIVFPTEKRLDMQDTLCVNEYGIFVCKPANDDIDVNFPLYTYGNRQAFTAAAGAALDATFYSNGIFTTQVNNDIVIPYRGLYNHLYRPQTQATAAPGAGSPLDQIRLAEDGFITQEPNILLIGSKNYVPMINLKANLPTVDEFTRAVLIYRGVLAQNSTVVS